jgi:hypothetical protein
MATGMGFLQVRVGGGTGLVGRARVGYLLTGSGLPTPD